MIVLKAKVLVTVMAVSSVLISAPATAATSPKITWKVNTLRPSTSVSITALASTNSRGVKSWSVSGACSLKKGKLTTKSIGTCAVRLSIKARGKFGSRTVTKRFAVTKSKNSTVVQWSPAVTKVIAASNCMLPDRRDPSLINAPRSLGFPLNQTGSKAIGTINLVLVAADFPNFAGRAEEITKLEEQIRLFDEWLAFQSNGKLKATWQFPKKFVRMPRLAADYGIVGFTVGTHTALVSDVVAGADSDVNFASVDEMFVYMPDSLTDSEPGRNPFDGILSQFGGVDVSTPEGVIKHVKGSGTVSKQIQYGLPPTLWALWAHDLLHTIGVEGHNPDKSASLESEDYLNFVISSWNQWLLGWMTNEQIACIDKSTANGMDVDLVPLQSNASGFRTAIMPISETRAIVVESHRNTGYGKNFGASGILAYLMDTKNVQPYADRDKTALIGSKFLDPNTVIKGSRARVGKGQNSSLMLAGEYAEFESVRIEFVKSGDLDKIRFTVSG